jgi:hypothetical protein
MGVKALIGSFVVVVLLAFPASATDTTKQGAASSDRRCYNYPASYVGEGCRFKRLNDDSLRVKAVDARATVRYRFFVPRKAKIDHIRIAWEDPSDLYACYGETKRAVRVGRRLGVDAVSGRRGHVSLCVIDHVRVTWHR